MISVGSLVEVVQTEKIVGNAKNYSEHLVIGDWRVVTNFNRSTNTLRIVGDEWWHPLRNFKEVTENEIKSIPRCAEWNSFEDLVKILSMHIVKNKGHILANNVNLTLLSSISLTQSNIKLVLTAIESGKFL